MKLISYEVGNASQIQKYIFVTPWRHSVQLLDFGTQPYGAGIDGLGGVIRVLSVHVHLWAVADGGYAGNNLFDEQTTYALAVR